MSRSRHLTAGTALPAAALAAALVLAPTAAFAVDGDPVAADAPGASSAETPVTPVGDETVEPTATGTDAIATDAGGATSASGSAEGPRDTASVDAPPVATDPAPAPAETVPAPVEPTASADEVPAEAPEDEVPSSDGPFVFGEEGALYPGTAATVYGIAFTPGDLVSVEVSGEGVDEGIEYVRLAGSDVFDADGSIEFSVELPEGFPIGGVVTVTVSDEHDLSTSTDFDVALLGPTPRLEVPVGATAGVVTITGENALPGEYVFVDLYDAEDAPVDEGPVDGEPVEVGPLRLAADEPDAGEPDAGEPGAGEPGDGESGDEGVPVDVEPVPYETTGGAATIVAVDAAGRFAARFVLPAGDFAIDAVTFDDEQTTMSSFSEPVYFSVAAAATPVVTAPVVTPAGTVPAASTVRPLRATASAVRASSLAYTGSEPSGAAAWALGAIVAGAGALVAGRLRPRRR